MEPCLRAGCSGLPGCRSDPSRAGSWLSSLRSDRAAGSAPSRRTLRSARGATETDTIFLRSVPGNRAVVGTLQYTHGKRHIKRAVNRTRCVPHCHSERRHAAAPVFRLCRQPEIPVQISDHVDGLILAHDLADLLPEGLSDGIQVDARVWRDVLRDLEVVIVLQTQQKLRNLPGITPDCERTSPNCNRNAFFWGGGSSIENAEIAPEKCVFSIEKWRLYCKSHT